MSTYDSRSILRPLVISGFICLAAPAAHADDWPISYANLRVPASAYGGADRKAPKFDCQPDSFDPQKTPYRHGSSPDAYEVEGSNKATTVMVIDGWKKEGDAKTTLAEPYSLTKYIFACASQPTQVFEFKKDSARFALYTHITTAMFSPDHRKLVMFNYLTHHGAWHEMRRIIEIGAKKFTPLPVMNETNFLADVANDRVVTYGTAAKAGGKQKGPVRIAAIWGPDGKLIRALSVPVQPAPAGTEAADDTMGMLPGEPTTFYHLIRTGENTCTLRLQNIKRPDGRRSIQLAVPGSANDPAAVGTRVQLDLADLKLQGGAMKYRVSASGKGDASNDWGPWQAAE